MLKDLLFSVPFASVHDSGRIEIGSILPSLRGEKTAIRSPPWFSSTVSISSNDRFPVESRSKCTRTRTSIFLSSLIYFFWFPHGKYIFHRIIDTLIIINEKTMTKKNVHRSRNVICSRIVDICMFTAVFYTNFL